MKAKINFLLLGNGSILLAALAPAEFRGIVQEALYNFLFTHDVAQVESARQMQVTFRKQVQAWKDILIRGSDPANLEKQQGVFVARKRKWTSPRPPWRARLPIMSFSKPYPHLRMRIPNWARNIAPA